MKKLIVDKSVVVRHWSMCCRPTGAEVCDALQVALKRAQAAAHPGAPISVHWSRDPGGDGGGIEDAGGLVLRFERYETDDEERDRETRAAERAAHDRRWRKAEYEKLKAEFEPKEGP